MSLSVADLARSIVARCYCSPQCSLPLCIAECHWSCIFLLLLPLLLPIIITQLARPCPLSLPRTSAHCQSSLSPSLAKARCPWPMPSAHSPWSITIGRIHGPSSLPSGLQLTIAHFHCPPALPIAHCPLRIAHFQCSLRLPSTPPPTSGCQSAEVADGAPHGEANNDSH